METAREVFFRQVDSFPLPTTIKIQREAVGRLGGLLVDIATTIKLGLYSDPSGLTLERARALRKVADLLRLTTAIQPPK